jgi:hypothetical protein
MNVNPLRLRRFRAATFRKFLNMAVEVWVGTDKVRERLIEYTVFFLKSEGSTT